jgi:hypothetical protein
MIAYKINDSTNTFLMVYLALRIGGRGRMQILDLLSLLVDVTSLVKDFSEFSTSDSPFHLGIMIVGFVKAKKEDT